MKMKSNERTFVTPDGGYGWIIVAASILINSSLVPIILCFGIIYENKFSDMNISASQISFLLHLNNSLLCTLGLFSGPLLKKFDYRQVALLGVFLCCLGIFLTVFAESYAAFICTISILLGVGNGILMPGTYMAVNSYFEKNLTLAISFQVTGSSLVGIFMPQVCHSLLNNYGIHGTTLILAGISLHAVPAAMMLRPIEKAKRKEPAKERMLPAEDKTEMNDGSDKLLQVYNQTTTSKESQIKVKLNVLEIVKKTFNFELFAERAYLVIVIGMSISFASELNTILMTSFVLTELSGFNRSDLAIAVSLQATTDVIGRLLVPVLAHRSGWSPKVTYAFALIGSSIGRTMLSLLYEMKAMSYASIAILGLGKGSKAVFQSLILPKHVSYDNLAAANGLLMVVNGILSLILGPLIGLTHDISNSYIYSLHTSTVLSLSCVALWVVDHIARSRQINLETDENPS